MKKQYIGLGAAAVMLGGLTMGSGVVAAYQGDPSVQGPNHTEERHAAILAAFENNDYQAWSELMAGKGRVTQMVNEENFPRFAEAHRLAAAGDVEGAKQIRTELGLGLRNGAGQAGDQNSGQNGTGQGKNQGSGMGRWQQ